MSLRGDKVHLPQSNIIIRFPNDADVKNMNNCCLAVGGFKTALFDAVIIVIGGLCVPKMFLKRH